MKEKAFWKGVAAALAVVLAVSVAWKPICRIIPWQLLPFEIALSRSTKLDMIEDYLEEYYVEELDEELLDDMLYTGMLAGANDRYTYYLPQETLEQYMENSNGQFDGIGIEVYQNEAGEVVVGNVLEGLPAEEAGFQKGDVIIGVDGEDMREKPLSEVAVRIRGKAGTEVRVQLLREKETLEYTVKRTDVVVQSVEGGMLADGIGYIAISGFKENTPEQFKTTLTALQEQGMEGLILDLRDNPGGLVRSVYQIGEELLPEGTMVYTLDKKENRNDLKCDAEYTDIPLVVLVNENSASASEILAGAVQDLERGTLVGTQTFGKGLVQRLFVLPDGSGINVTIQKYYTPNGTSIHGIGITPDEVVELPEAYRNRTISAIPAGEDTQLQKALSVLQAEMQK